MDTSSTLLERLRRPGQQEAWARFVQLYTPLLFYWACRAGLQQADAADLVQDVFTVLVEKLPEFDYDRQKSFRGWLRTILLNRWRNRRRQHSAQPLQSDDVPPAEGAGPDDMADLEEADYRRQLVGRALELIRADFQPATWKAFWECQVAGRPAAEVAAELNMKPGAVRAARFRVLCRLRQEVDGLLE
jgi:RNA polymerase sigma-70 factor (ECF subfamily)